MSAYGHIMEREISAHSLSSRGNSEMGSRFTMETGIYMSSFAATVFIAGLVTVGVSIMTLLITLTVMLQSCQNKNSGVIEGLRASKSTYNYHYCLAFAMHMELNNLDSNSFSEICKDAAIQYIREGQYMNDLNVTVQLAENYFSTIEPLEDGKDVVLMDADDFFPEEDLLYPNLSFHQSRENGCSDCTDDYAKNLKLVFVQKLYMKLQARGWQLVLLSRKPEKLRNATIEYLLSSECSGWSSLIMRKNHEMQTDTLEYFSAQRTALQDAGFRIVAAISSRLDALTGPSPGKRVFKLPNPISVSSQQHISSA